MVGQGSQFQPHLDFIIRQELETAGADRAKARLIPAGEQVDLTANRAD